MRALVAVAILTAVGCGGSPAAPPADSFLGQVSDTAHEPVVGATVFAIPAELLVWSPLTASDVKSTATADFDEPLERLIDSQGPTFPHAVTNRNGEYALALATGRYYLYVVPDPTNDPVHLPGGSASRSSRSAAELITAGRLDIKVSSQPSSFATQNFIGSEACLGCHAEQEG